MTRRVQQLESQLAKEQEKYAQTSRAAGEQVVRLCVQHICQYILAQFSLVQDASQV
jgi:hypothetical protein